MRPVAMPPTLTAGRALLVAAALLAGCPGPHPQQGGSGVETMPTLATGAIVVRDGGSMPMGTTNYGRAFGIADVALRGNVLMVLLVDQVTGLTATGHDPRCPLTCPPISTNLSSSSYQILVSRDLGATWQAPVPVPAWPSPTALSPPPIPYGVLVGGLASAQRYYVVHHWTGSDGSVVPTIREIDLSTGRWVTNATLDDVLLSRTFGQRLAPAAGFDSFTDPRGVGPYTATLTFDSYNLSTGTLTHNAVRTTTAWRYPDFFTTTNGVTWVAAQPEGSQVCVYRVTPSSSLTPNRICFADALFPPEIGSPTAGVNVVETTRWPLLVSAFPRNGDHHAMATLVESSPLPIDLGPIDIPIRDPGVHLRYGGLLLGSQLSVLNGQQVLDLTSTGIDVVSVPATPCITTDCGTGLVSLAWLQPVSGGDMLAFYTIDSGLYSGGLYGQQLTSHPYVVMRRVTPTRTPYAGTPSSLAARAAPGLMNACTAMSSCFGTPRQRCVDTFQVKNVISPSRNTLLTSYTSGCGVLGPLWPDASWPGRGSCVAGCSGNVAVTCAGSTVATATDCGNFASTCGMTPGSGVLACNDGSATLTCNACSANGGAVTCDHPVPTVTGCAGLGRSCQVTSTGPICPIPTACTNEVLCSGDTLTRCVEGSLRTTDCAEHGLTCSTASGGGCVPAAPYAACVAGTFTETCDGTRALYCSGGALLASDCAVLGFARCTVVGGEARCAN